MDTLYARIKYNIALAIERCSLLTYPKIEFRKADSFGLYLKKHIHLYRQILKELKFDFMYEDKDILLYVHPDKNSSIPNFIKETTDDCIIKTDRNFD